jgi:hypothetical protein
MAPIAQQIANMVDMLPESDQAFALEFIKKLVLAWDPEYTKVTPVEKAQLDRAAAEMATGDYLTEDAINWN